MVYGVVCQIWPTASVFWTIQAIPPRRTDGGLDRQPDPRAVLLPVMHMTVLGEDVGATIESDVDPDAAPVCVSHPVIVGAVSLVEEVTGTLVPFRASSSCTVSAGLI
jgi:hypothetical protein